MTETLDMLLKAIHLSASFSFFHHSHGVGALFATFAEDNIKIPGHEMMVSSKIDMDMGSLLYLDPGRDILLPLGKSLCMSRWPAIATQSTRSVR